MVLLLRLCLGVQLLANDLSVLCLAPSPDSNWVNGRFGSKECNSEEEDRHFKLLPQKRMQQRFVKREHGCHGIQD